MPKPTAKRGRRGGRRVPVERRRLPAGPLLEAVDAYAARRRQPVEELLDDALPDRLRDAARSGTVTVGAAERCCDALGWHPRMLWGQAYDQAIADPHAPHGPRYCDRLAAGMPVSGLPRRQHPPRQSPPRPRAPARPAPLSPHPGPPQRRTGGTRWQATTSPSRSAT